MLSLYPTFWPTCSKLTRDGHDKDRNRRQTQRKRREVCNSATSFLVMSITCIFPAYYDTLKSSFLRMKRGGVCRFSRLLLNSCSEVVVLFTVNSFQSPVITLFFYILSSWACCCLLRSKPSVTSLVATGVRFMAQAPHLRLLYFRGLEI